MSVRVVLEDYRWIQKIWAKHQYWPRSQSTFSSNIQEGLVWVGLEPGFHPDWTVTEEMTWLWFFLHAELKLNDMGKIKM